jgi:two-component system phosphate regulon sensor histidine kinase PhoR
MMKRYGLWITAILLLTALLTVLATRWNVIWIHSPSEHPVEQVLGTVGFIVIFGGLLLFGIKLFHEMRMNQAQSEFLARISHELKTPLSTLELSSELLRSDPEPTERKRLWDLHHHELSRLKNEVDLLLEASRWDSLDKKSSVFLEFKEASFEEWIQSQWTAWTHRAGSSETLKRIGSPLNKNIEADFRYLRLIIDNLIDNAKKYSIDSKPNIEFRTSHNHFQWRIELSDKGWGFNPEDVDKIFKRFYRSANLAPYSIAGTGLGLYLQKLL